RQKSSSRFLPAIPARAQDTGVHPEDEPDGDAGQVKTTFPTTRLGARVRTLLDPRDRHLAATRRLRLWGASEKQAGGEGRPREEFLAALSHELRNPLAAISAALELMKLHGGGIVERERAVIERQAGHLLRVIDDLLNAASFSPGRVALRLTVAEVSSA